MPIPITSEVAARISTSEITAETMNPLYNAPIIFCDAPSFTKKAPIIEPMIETPPIIRG